jgi:hypothetical protein
MALRIAFIIAKTRLKSALREAGIGGSPFLFRIRNEDGFRQLLRDSPKVPPILNARFAEVK